MKRDQETEPGRIQNVRSLRSTTRSPNGSERKQANRFRRNGALASSSSPRSLTHNRSGSWAVSIRNGRNGRNGRESEFALISFPAISSSMVRPPSYLVMAVLLGTLCHRHLLPD